MCNFGRYEKSVECNAEAENETSGTCNDIYFSGPSLKSCDLDLIAASPALVKRPWRYPGAPSRSSAIRWARRAGSLSVVDPSCV